MSDTGVDEFVHDADEEDCTGLVGLGGKPDRPVPARPIYNAAKNQVGELRDDQACREGNPTVHARFTLWFRVRSEERRVGKECPV